MRNMYSLFAIRYSVALAFGLMVCELLALTGVIRSPAEAPWPYLLGAVVAAAWGVQKLKRERTVAAELANAAREDVVESVALRLDTLAQRLDEAAAAVRERAARIRSTGEAQHAVGSAFDIAGALVAAGCAKAVMQELVQRGVEPGAQ